MNAALDPLRRHPISSEEYLRMGNAGVFAAEARLELIEGEIVEMAPIGSLHAGTVKGLIRLLGRLVGNDALLSVQDPLILSEHSVPQPDLALLKPRGDNYVGSHPTGHDALLVIEVADSTLAFDLGAKAMLYAGGGIAELWVVDVSDRSVRVFREPSSSGYRTSFTVTGTQSVHALLLPAILVPLAEIFPK